MTVIAPFVLSEGAGTPYVTLDEVKFSPTAAALDFSNLVENASQAVQDRALHDLIVRASDMADRHVYGALGTLTATVNTGNGRYRQNRYGQFIIHPDYWPILEVRSFSAGIDPGTQNAYSLTSSNVSIEREQFIITAQAGLSNITTTYGSLGIVGYNQGVDIQQFCQWTYVNGFGNTFLSAAVSAGTTAIPVQSVIGFYPGQTVTLWDGMNNENVTIASVGSTTITVSTGLTYAHGTGCNLSALPATVKQAVIHLVVGLVKQRGQGGLVLNELGEPSAVGASLRDFASDMAQGYDLLDHFKAVWGRS